MKFLVFISVFLLVPPLAEIAMSAINYTDFFDNQIYLYVFYLIIALAVSAIIAGLRSSRIFVQAAGNFDFSFGNKELFSVALFGVIALQLFIIKSLAAVSFLDIVVFTEEYRNGIYKGSGAYTVLLLHVLPTMLAVNIAFGIKFGRMFYVCLLIICAATLVLGLRVYLLKIILAFVYRISSKRVKYRVLFFSLVLLMVFLAFYKAVLGFVDSEEVKLTDYILNPLTRLNFESIVNFNFGQGIEDSYCLVPTFQYTVDCGGELFKLNYFSSHGKIAMGFPNLSKYSGVALPLPTYLFNLFGFIGLPFMMLYMLTIVGLYNYSKRASPNTLSRIFVFVCLTHLVSASTEDLLFTQSIDVSLASVLLALSIRRIITLFEHIKIL